MNRLKIVPAHPSDALELAETLREDDLREVKAFTGRPVALELMRPLTIKDARTLAIKDDSGILALFGVAPLKKGVGNPWMLSSDPLFTRHLREFVRRSQGVIADLTRGYRSLEGHVFSENEVHIRWLKRVGFRFDPKPVPWGEHQLQFWRFYR